MSLYQPILVINSPEYLTDIFINKGTKYIEKTELIKQQIAVLLGDSSIMMVSNEEQARKRKVISTAFYKDKLLVMVETIKRLVAEKIEDIT